MSDVRIILEVDELANFPENGREDVYYFSILEGDFYRFDGANYVPISSGGGVTPTTTDDYTKNFLLGGM